MSCKFFYLLGITLIFAAFSCSKGDRESDYCQEHRAALHLPHSVQQPTGEAESVKQPEEKRRAADVKQQINLRAKEIDRVAHRRA